MGYFANGTEGMTYEAEYCARCVHDDEENNCPVLVIHVLHNYEQHDKPELKTILDLLIPIGDDGFTGECRMFHRVTDDEWSKRDKNQEVLPL
jgi:hypothetical protein